MTKIDIEQMTVEHKAAVFIFCRKGAEKMERIEQGEDIEEIFENDIEMYLIQFFSNQNIEDIRTAPQNVWSAAMTYICRHVFADKSKIKRQGKMPEYHNDDPRFCNSSCYAYNFEIVYTICDYYIYLCNIYDKAISIMDFSRLTGINDKTIWEWGSNRQKLSPLPFEIYKKLYNGRENSLTNKLISNKNPLALIAVLNRERGWNLPGVSREPASRPALTAADIRQRLETSESLKLSDNLGENGDENGTL